MDSLTVCLKKLSCDIIKVIFNYIIPNSTDIKFCKYYPNAHDTNYHEKYDVAYVKDIIVRNNKYFISRISKKNNKHLYYITKELCIRICSSCNSKKCKSLKCRGSFLYESYYTSKYISKNIDIALMHLL